MKFIVAHVCKVHAHQVGVEMFMLIKILAIAQQPFLNGIIIKRRARIGRYRTNGAQLRTVVILQQKIHALF